MVPDSNLIVRCIITKKTKESRYKMLPFNLARMFADVVYCNDIVLNVNSQHVIQDNNKSFYQVWFFWRGMVFLENPKMCIG